MGGLLTAGTPKSQTLFLFDADTAEEERAKHVLISNLGQMDGARGGLGNDHAQAFTTGGDSDGYIVTSVDMEFARSESVSALATALTVTIQSDSSGNPSGTILGTLTNPTFVSVNSDRTYEFTAPDAGIALAANTKYWFVVDVDAATVLSSNNAVRNTMSDDVDAGGVPGWDLDDDSRYRQRGSTGGWTSFHMAKKIRVKGRIVGELTSNDDGSYTVPHNWVLTPTGIGEGEKFRLLFRSSTFRNAQSTDIADYNTHVQNAATAGHAYIQRYGATFRVLGCTAAVNAKVNTGTDSGTGEPIYWLNGDKVADDYAGFYDGTWDVHANSAVRSEHGTQPPHSRWPYSGCNNDGTSSSNPLGHATVNQAVPGDGGAGKALNQGSTTGNARTNLGYYALSPVFVVGAVPEPPPEAFVPHDWPLIPSDISEGGKFRLLVLTSAQRDGTSSDIADYNTHVQNAVNGGHASIQGFSAEFKAIVSTAEVDARDNIATFGTGSPIYWLNGEKVADDYADFHDATWDSHAARNEHGQTQASPNGYFTGSNEDGTQKTGNTLGAARVQIGSVGLGIDAGSNIGNTFNTEFLGISPVFVVSAADAEVTVPANWALTPTGLNPGDKFRLLFQTSTRRDATPTDIAVYDTYVQNLAAAGHTAIQRYSSQFKVVGSTASVDARDHTSTTGTGHPIYWLNGPRVAANYAGFWSDNWENWGTSDRRTEDGTQGDNDWHWTGTDEDGTKHSNPLGNTGTNVRRGQFSTGASSRNPISHWDTDKTENHSFYAISPVFVVPTPAPTGSVPTALISLVPVKENYGDDSLTALYYNEEPHDGHELDWHATKETTPLTFRVEHVQWPYNERGVNYDITFNLYVFDDYGFVGGTRYIPDTHTLPANQAYVDIALPITPRGNNNSGPVTIYLMGGSQKPGEVGRYLTGNRELTYFVLDGTDSGLGADDTTAIALHAASVTRNAVLHTTRHFTEYRAEGRAVAFDIELRGVDTGAPLASIAPDTKVYYKVIGCEGIIKGGSQTQIGGVGNVIDSFPGRNGFAKFAVGQSKITVTVPTVNDNVDEPDCNLQVAVTDSDHKTLPEGGKPYVFTLRDIANNPNYYSISYASKPFTGGRLNDKFFAPPFDEVGICDCDGNADDGSMVTHGEVYQYEIAVSELQSGHEGEPVYFQLQAKLAPGEVLPAPLDVSVTISSEGDIGVPTSTQTVTIPVGGRVTLPAIATTDDADGIANSSVTATINQSHDYVVWPQRGSATVELTESAPWPTVSVDGYIGIHDGEDHEGHWVFFEFTAEDPIPTESLEISVTTTVLGDFGITESTQTITFDPDLDGYAELNYLTTDDSVDEPDGEVTVTINPGPGYVVADEGYDTSTVEVKDNDAGAFDGKKAKDHPLIKYAALVETFYDRITANHQHGDDASGGWNKRFLKAMRHAEYINYPQDAATVADAQSIYDRISPGGSTAWDGTVEALTYAYDYYAPADPPSSTPVITISGGAGITEGGTASYTITSTPAPASPITVNVGVSETGAWGASGSTTVSVSAATTTYTVTTTDDQVDEADGSVTATIQSGSDYTVGSPSSASVNVADNDDPLPVITISGGSGITEGGSASYTITSTPAPASPITVNVALVETGNWGATGSTTVAVSAATTTYTVTTADDDVDETDGSIEVVVQSGTGYTVGTASSASVNVADNDDPTPQVAPEITISGGSGITEGGTATFTISANPAPPAPITVNIGVSETGSFGASGAATVSVSSATTSYTITTTDDQVDESNGSVTATVQSGDGYTLGSPSSASVSVADNDDPAPTLIHTCQPTKTGNNASLTDTPLTITETGGVRTLRIPENGKYVCLKLDNPGGSGRQIWRSDVFTIGGEEAVRVEWTEDNKVSFIYARFLDDDVYTGDRETATVRLAGGNKQWKAVIVDDETGVTPPPATPVITISGGTGITEGGTATFTISANPAPASPITVNVGVSETGSWSASGAATVSVSGGTTTYTVSTTNDNVDEPNGSVTAAVQSGSGYTVGSPSSASVNVADNDDPPPPPPATPVITISGGAGITEGGSATFTISANPAPASPITVNVGVSESGSWGASGASTVSVSGGTTTYTIATTNDNVDEANGSVTATVQSGNGYNVGSPSSASVNVADNDDAPPPPPATPVITISGGAGITEGGSATFTIYASPAPASPITVNIGVTESGSWGANGTATITVSGGTATYMVTTTDDDVDEPNGSITVRVQSGAGYTVGSPSSSAVSVADNDDAPEDPDPPATDKLTKAQLIEQATALQDKYAKLQHESLTHRGLYMDIKEVVKALNGEPSRLDTEWYAPQLMRRAINTANKLGDTHAAEVLAQARDFLGIKVLE